MTPNKPLKLGLAGLGTVGSGLLALLSDNGPLIAERSGRAVKVVAVSARDRKKKRAVPVDHLEWFDDPVALATSSGIDVFVELMGGEDGAALDSVEAALHASRHVVTANKAMMAKHGIRLAKIAEANAVALSFEAAVAGGIPIVKTLRESLLGNTVSRVHGILNGTSNFILTRMQEEGVTFAEALTEAQELGYAEADPTFDVDGQDAGHKLSLLAALAFGIEPHFDAVHLEGIRGIAPADFEAADELGYRIKLLAVASRTHGGIEARVSPTMVPKTATVAGVDGVLNCVAIEGDYSGPLVLAGPGAGARPTASSVASDIIDIARGHINPPFIIPAERLKKAGASHMRAHEGSYYIRLSVFDRTGAFAAIAHRMAEQGISLESIVQKPAKSGLAVRPVHTPGEPTTVVLITHPTREASVRTALDAIFADGNVAGQAQVIRIEHL